jgi:hypothetical protein
MGAVWGVAMTSTISQNVLTHKLPIALANIPNKEKVTSSIHIIGYMDDQITNETIQIIQEIRHSVSALNNLPLDVQEHARLVYFEAIKYSFIASSTVAAIALISAFFAKGKSLHRK